MNILLISDIGKICVFLMVLLSVFLMTAKSNKKLSNYLFAAFLLVTAFDFIGLFILEIPNKILTSLKMASVLLQMPLYYLYVQSVCYFNFKLEGKHLLHTVLFIGILLLLFASPDKGYDIFEILVKIQYYCYIIAVFFTLANFKKLYQENYTANHQNTYRWILQITILFLIGNLFVQFRYFMPKENNSVLLANINLFISIFALSIICWFVLKALYQPSLFLGVDKNLTPLKAKVVKILTVETEQNIQLISDYMHKEKPYLDAELNLQKLSAAVNLPEKQLSQLINQHIGKHFFDYINEFRINDAKLLLKEKPELTVLEILYEVGFNSKSSFYTAFKKESQQTPTAYRKSSS